jgi:hypothetical protein
VVAQCSTVGVEAHCASVHLTGQRVTRVPLAFCAESAIIKEGHAFAPRALPGQRQFEENAMVRTEVRVILATLAIFIALGGIGLSIHGSLYYLDEDVWVGVIAIVIGIAGCVTMLTLWPHDLPDKPSSEHPADDAGPHEHPHHLPSHS